MIRNIAKYSGIGEASASAVLASLSLNPTTVGLTTGFMGRIIFFICKIFFTVLAALGLVILNVGASKIQTLVDEGNYTGSREDAEKLIEAIRTTGRDLTPEEIKEIDEPVKAAFRKFGRFGKKKVKK